MTDTKFCERCGSALPEGAETCPACGAPVNAAATYAPYLPPANPVIPEPVMDAPAPAEVFPPSPAPAPAEVFSSSPAPAPEPSYPPIPPMPETPRFDAPVAPPAKSNRTAWIIGGVVGALLLCCCCLAAIILLVMMGANGDFSALSLV